MRAALWLFAFSLGAGLYLYLGYPALVLCRAMLWPRPIRRAPIRPRVSIIVAAHNEQAVIEQKIRNTEALEYPRDRLELIIVSDGSTDRTVEIARRVLPRQWRVLDAPRRGKAHALNLGVAAALGEVLVFTDANTTLAQHALIRLVECLGDPAVGGVCGNKRYLPAAHGDATARGEGTYWEFDTWLKTLESAAGSVFAADGALYAVRRQLYVPIAEPAQADDIAISARVVLQRRRLVFEPGALVFEPPPADGALEFRRKVRVTNHSLSALLDLGPGLWSAGFYSVQLLSHKFLRHFTPVFLLLLVGATFWLAPYHRSFAVLAATQLGFAGLAAVGYALRKQPVGNHRWLAYPSYCCGVNLAALAGIVSVLRGRRLQLWSPRAGVAEGA